MAAPPLLSVSDPPVNVRCAAANRVMSAGIDVLWRRKAMAALLHGRSVTVVTSNLAVYDELARLCEEHLASRRRFALHPADPKARKR